MTESRNRHRLDGWIVATVFLIGLAGRLIYLSQYEKSPLFVQIIGPDVSEYDAWARRILIGEWLWHKVDIHAPLYPYYLAGLYYLCSVKIYWVRLLQMIVVALAFIPLGLELRRRYHHGVNRVLPLLFLAGAWWFTPLFFYSGELVSEALMVPLLSLALAVLYSSDRGGQWQRRGGYALGGVLCGLAVISHPLSIFFPAGIVLVLLVRWWRNRRGRRGLFFPVLTVMFLGGVALIIFPVSAYNSYLLKAPVLVQKNSGYNFYLGNNPEATGGCYIWPGPIWNRIHGQAGAAARQMGISKDQYFFHRSVSFITDHPWQWLGKVGQKALYTWNWQEMAAGPDLPELKYFTPLMKHSWWMSGGMMMLALAGLIGIAAAGRWERVKGRYFLVLVLSSWAALSLTVVGGRYRLMLFPGVFFLFAWYVMTLIQQWRQRTRRNLLIWLVLLVPAGAIVWLPQPKIDAQAESAQAYTILGEAYLNDGNRSAALHYLLLAEQTLYNWSRSYNILGRFYETSDPKKAEKYFRQAIATDPEEAYGYVNIANLYSNRHDFSTAGKWFVQALTRGADDPQVLYNAGLFELRRGQRGQAAIYLHRCLDARPDDRRALNTMAVISLLDGKAAAAQQFLRAALRLEPRNANLMVNLAAACMQDKKMTEATQWVARALRQQPGHPGALELQRRLKPGSQR